ncbi:unnamed protein product [Effrenium voratum]|nr:unnamed protein product [Effrenium voratum]
MARIWRRGAGRWARHNGAGEIPEVHWIAGADDLQAVIYRHRDRRNHPEYERQVRAIASNVLQTEVPLSLRKLQCPVRVHYSWDCLRRLLQAKAAGRRIEVDSVLLCEPSNEELRLAASASSRVLQADRKLIEAEFAFEGTTQKRSVNYVVAYPVPQPLALARPPVLVLDGLGAQQNIGQVLRTAYHLGVTSVLVSRPVWNSLGGRTCRVSMGWLYFMDFYLGEPLSDGLRQLREQGLRIFCAEDHFAEPVEACEPGDRNWALVVGHEDQGVSADCVALSDARICVPQRGGESLNVAHAAAICLYELSRQMDENIRGMRLQSSWSVQQAVQAWQWPGCTWLGKMFVFSPQHLALASDQMSSPWGPDTLRLELISAVELGTLRLLSALSETPAPFPADAVGPALQGARGERLGLELGRLLRRGRRLQLRRQLALLDSVHGLLMSKRHATPRELFYRHVELFPRQQLSNDLLKSLCQTLEVPRHALRLVGTAKGLVRGHLRIMEPRFDGEEVWVDGMDALEPRGHSISPICAHVLQVQTMAEKVFVVEKETVFHRLLDEGFLEQHKPCVLVTARGFPDVPTRYFLRLLRDSCRIFLLVDFDPSGLQIAATYSFGPEVAWMQEDLTLPAAVPLLGGSEVAAAERLPLTRRDVALARGLQRRLGWLQGKEETKRRPV